MHRPCRSHSCHQVMQVQAIVREARPLNVHLPKTGVAIGTWDQRKGAMYKNSPLRDI
jgi:hypothetical protein